MLHFTLSQKTLSRRVTGGFISSCLQDPFYRIHVVGHRCSTASYVITQRILQVTRRARDDSMKDRRSLPQKNSKIAAVLLLAGETSLGQGPTIRSEASSTLGLLFP